MSTPEPPPGTPPPGWPFPPDSGSEPTYTPVSPLLPDDPPKVGPYWLDARLGASPAGIAFTAHDADNQPAMVLLLAQGAAADHAARARFAGEINAMHIDTVLARGGEGQSTGRLGRKFTPEDDPVTPDARQPAPWAALAYDGSPAAAAEAERILDAVQLATLVPQGTPSGPDYQQYWVERVKPGLARLWPLPWPGRYDRAGWRTILVSWLLMLLLAALAVLIAILLFRNQPPQAPPPPTGGSGSPPPVQLALAGLRLAGQRIAVRLPVAVRQRISVRLPLAVGHRVRTRPADRERHRAAGPADHTRLATIDADAHPRTRPDRHRPGRHLPLP